MAKPIKHRGKWRIRWIDGQGIRRSEVYDYFSDAEFALRRHEVEAEEVRRGLRSLQLPNKTFSELCDYWLKTRSIHKRSWKDDRSIIQCHLLPAFKGLKLVEFTVSHADQFVAERTQLHPKTIHNHLTLLIAMLNQAVELGWIVKAPRIRKPKINILEGEYHYLRTQEEIDRFLRGSREFSEKHFILYATAIYTGMRQGELAGLVWENVNFEKRLITVQRSFFGPTKSGNIRYVPILDALLPLLRQWKLKTSGSYVFPNSWGNMLQPSSRIFQEDFQKLLLETGFKSKIFKVKIREHLVFHDLRHTFASHWVMRGGDIFKLQKILGHKSIQMTMRYAHLALDAFSQDYDRLGKEPRVFTNSIIPINQKISISSG